MSDPRLAETVDRHIARSHAAQAAGDAAGAAEHARKAAAAARRRGDSRIQAIALRRLAACLTNLNRPDDALVSMAAGLELADPSDHVLVSALLCLRASVIYVRGNVAGALDDVVEATVRLGQVAEPSAMLAGAWSNLGTVYELAELFELNVECVERAHAIAVACGEDSSLFALNRLKALSAALDARAISGHTPADEYAVLADELAAFSGGLDERNVGDACEARVLEAYCRLRAGQPQRAAQIVERVDPNGSPDAANRMQIHHVLALVAASADSLDVAQRHFDAALSEAADVEWPFGVATIRRDRVALARRRGDADATVVELEALARHYERTYWSERPFYAEAVRSRIAVGQLQRHAAAIEETAHTDPLTSLPNRRFVDARAEPLIAAVERRGGRLTMAVIDVDRFKEINDNWTHLVGDDALRAVARAIVGNVRKADVAGRYGGDEFVVLFPRTTLTAARRVAERIRAAVTAAIAEMETVRAGGGTLSVSIGLAELLAGERRSSLFRRADIALYVAKRAGGNRVETSAVPRPARHLR